MEYRLALFALTAVVLGQTCVSNAQTAVLASQPTMKYAAGSGDIPTLPAPPKGKSTILGGEIRSIDPVRDELSLRVFGQRPVKILFDERTLIYRDGKRIPLRELGPVDHASVQTLLDGTNVFALSIHILTQAPEGDYRGRVLNYNPETSELTIASAMFREPIKLRVATGTAVTRVGQPAFVAEHKDGFDDLTKGALVSVRFQSDKQGHGVADQITVLAVPGSAFVFIGNVSVLDMHSGTLSLVDPEDDKTYQVSFNPSSLPISQSLHKGDHIIVTADFEGGRYMATAITINN